MDNIWSTFKNREEIQRSLAVSDPLLIQKFDSQIASSEIIALPSAPLLTSSLSKSELITLCLFSIWAFPALGIISYVLYLNHRALSRLKRRRLVTDSALLELLEDCKEDMGVRLPVGLVSSPGVETPMIVGFLRPVMAIPQRVIEEFSHVEIKHIMLHELAHVKRCDIAMNWLMAFLQAFHWFNPFIWIAFSLMRSDREQICDMIVLECEGYDKKISYGETVIKLLGKFNKPRFLPETAGIMEGGIHMKSRIEQIGKLGGKLKNSTVLGVITMALLAAASLTGAQGITKKPADEEAKAVQDTKQIQDKLTSIIIDLIQFEDVSFASAVDFLRHKSKELDPEKKGVNIILELTPDELKDKTITMTLENVPLREAIKYICGSANLDFQIDKSGIVIIRKKNNSSEAEPDKAKEKDDFLKIKDKKNRTMIDLSKTARKMAQDDPVAASKWAEKLPEADSRVFSSIANEWLDKDDPEEAAKWVLSLPEGESRDETIVSFSMRRSVKDPKATLEWIMEIPEDSVKTKMRALQAVLNGWSLKDLPAAKAWVNNSKLTKEKKSKLIAGLDSYQSMGKKSKK